MEPLSLTALTTKVLLSNDKPKGLPPHRPRKSTQAVVLGLVALHASAVLEVVVGLLALHASAVPEVLVGLLVLHAPAVPEVVVEVGLLVVHATMKRRRRAAAKQEADTTRHQTIS